MDSISEILGGLFFFTLASIASAQPAATQPANLRANEQRLSFQTERAGPARSERIRRFMGSATPGKSLRSSIPNSMESPNRRRAIAGVSATARLALMGEPRFR